MYFNSISWFSSLLCMFGICVIVRAEFTTEDCKELGFDKTMLMCSSCEYLDDFGLEQIKDQCKECCQKDDTMPLSKRYAKAVLEVCTCKFGAYPQIQAFIKSDRPKKFHNLSIKYLRGIDPIVKMMDADGNVKETLSIKKWNTDTVEEFFETHLEKDNAEDYLSSNKV
ncbi:selenoprotein F [Bradysia coprophila]|uniref:selenoprotein F n=1 Tax=Bradysia coprophila TaxID=38358 RepID=UPI00187DB05A|nr:selenoprotein F [Bradysia coprophila]